MPSAEFMSFLEILVFVATVKLIGDTIYNIMKKYSVGLSILGCVLVAAGLALSVLTSSMEKERIPASYLVLIPIFAYFAMIGVVTFITGRVRKNRLGGDCIVQAFDRMDMGLCYYDGIGRIILCNEYMHSLSMEMFGSRVLHGEVLQKGLKEMDISGERLKNGPKEMDTLGEIPKDNGENAKVTGYINSEAILDEKNEWNAGEGSSFEIKHEDNYYQVSVKKLSIKKVPLTEVKVTDVTDLHDKMDEIAWENQKLRKLNEHLVSYGSIVDSTIREREVLNAKIRIHDRFGEILLTAKRAIEQNTSDSDMDAIANYLRDVVSFMGSESNPQEDYYKDLLDISSAIGININLTGEMPKEQDLNKLFCLAIRECVTNTVKHANGHNVYVDVVKNPSKSAKYKMTIKNDGKQPSFDMELGTGMTSLQSKVEKAGGSMSVWWRPEFVLHVQV